MAESVRARRLTDQGSTSSTGIRRQCLECVAVKRLGCLGFGELQSWFRADKPLRCHRGPGERERRRPAVGQQPCLK